MKSICALLVFMGLFLAGCSTVSGNVPGDTVQDQLPAVQDESPTAQDELPGNMAEAQCRPFSPDILGAGFRYSVHGPLFDPGPSYWLSIGKSMASRFDCATPQAVWIVSCFNGQGTRFTFPGAHGNPDILFSPYERNEEALNLFDQQGVQVWLQIEPGQAPVEELIRIVLERYGHHPCVIGVGVDVEWYCTEQFAGEGFIADKDAAGWVRTVRSFNPSYWLFLKHWDRKVMPPEYREGIVFVDDGQRFESLESMEANFAAWGRAFAPYPVAFQYGYPSDRPWWGQMEDPADEIGRRILSCVPNAEGLFWVDFTVLDVFPPVWN